MSSPTDPIVIARSLFAQHVYDDLEANFDPSKWANINPTASAECDIVFWMAGLFTVDLRVWETACASVAGCTFDISAY